MARIPVHAVSVVLLAGTVLAQTAVRKLTTVDAIRQYPGYFHLQPVALRGELASAGERLMLRSDAREIRLLPSESRQPDGPVEVRGQMLDVGRLEPGDPRLGPYGREERERWPAPGEELVVSATSVEPAASGGEPSMRELALAPWKFEGQRVVVTGQFRGRNLFGDLPDAPKKSRYDFVLKAADAALWVTGLRPRGRGFDLNVDARVDTGRWLEATGVVRHERGLVRIEATRLQPADEPSALPAAEKVELPPPPPVEVVFSAPTEAETDVSPAASIRIQFSKGIKPETLKGRIRIGYVRSESFERGEAQPPAIEPKTAYDGGTRALEVSFDRPLERFRTVRLELLEGIEAFDGGPLVPWTLTFSIGG